MTETYDILHEDGVRIGPYASEHRAADAAYSAWGNENWTIVRNKNNSVHPERVEWLKNLAAFRAGMKTKELAYHPL